MQPVRERGLDGHDTKKESGRRPDGRWEENDASWETVEEEGPPYLATVRLQRGVYCRSKVHGISDPRGPNDRTRLPFGTPSRSGKTQEEGKDGLTPEMRRDVIPLDASNLTSLPMTGQTQVVGALPSHVIVAKVDVEDFRVGEGILAPLPLAFDGLVCRRHGRGRSAAGAGRVVLGGGGVEGGGRRGGRANPLPSGVDRDCQSLVVFVVGPDSQKVVWG